MTGQEIQKLRAKAGLSQLQAGELLGYKGNTAKQYISKLERGERGATAPVAKQLKEKLDAIIAEKESGLTEDRKSYLRGFSHACALLSRTGADYAITGLIYNVNFMTVQQLKSIGADPADIFTLKPIIKKLTNEAVTV